MSVAAVMERYKEHGDLPRALTEAGYPHLASAIGSGGSTSEFAPKTMREPAPYEPAPEEPHEEDETNEERRLRMRRQARDRSRDQQTANDMRAMDEGTPKMK